jgi:hypothetical protein
LSSVADDYSTPPLRPLAFPFLSPISPPRQERRAGYAFGELRCCEAIRLRNHKRIQASVRQQLDFVAQLRRRRRRPSVSPRSLSHAFVPSPPRRRVRPLSLCRGRASFVGSFAQLSRSSPLVASLAKRRSEEEGGRRKRSSRGYTPPHVSALQLVTSPSVLRCLLGSVCSACVEPHHTGYQSRSSQIWLP